MNDNVKYYVFAKKEIILIFLFLILSAIISFVIGVNVGKNYSYQAAGYTEEDRAKVDLLSTQEEFVEEIVKKQDEVVPEQEAKMIDSTYQRLEEEFNRLDEQVNNNTGNPQKNKRPSKAPARKETKKSKKVDQKVVVMKPETQTVEAVKSNKTDYAINAGKNAELSGKYTIQLGAYRSIDDAKKFSDGFSVRGYSPVINEVKLKNRGTWFRVSLGVFATVAAAKEYIKKEGSLFRGTDHVINRFD